MIENTPVSPIFGTGLWENAQNVASNYIPFAPLGPILDGDKLLARIERIEERLAILQPNKELQERYPALQEAYDAYKIIEKIVHDDRRSI